MIYWNERFSVLKRGTRLGVVPRMQDELAVGQRQHIRYRPQHVQQLLVVRTQRLPKLRSPVGFSPEQTSRGGLGGEGRGGGQIATVSSGACW